MIMSHTHYERLVLLVVEYVAVVSSSCCIASSIICNIVGDNFRHKPEPGFLAIAPGSLKRSRKRRIDRFDTIIASSKT